MSGNDGYDHLECVIGRYKRTIADPAVSIQARIKKIKATATEEVFIMVTLHEDMLFVDVTLDGAKKGCILGRVGQI